jgi:hypothetical protein
MSDLCKLGEKYNADKSPVFGNHTYTSQYDALLSSRRSEISLLLEIGIGNIPLMAPLTNNKYCPGASLRMWRDYLPHAQIVGCDILESVLFSEDRITTFQVDQSSVESLSQLINEVEKIHPYADIILDDGSHMEEHMVTSFQTLWKFVLPEKGIYIIEDIKISFFDRIVNLPTELGFKDAHCIMAYKGCHPGDNFVAFRKSAV